MQRDGATHGRSAVSSQGLAQVTGAVLDGAMGIVVLVEVDLAQGLPSIGVVGLAGTTVAEARWRVRSAVTNCGEPWPSGRLTIGLSPADVPKIGTGLDLAIAVGVLTSAGRLPRVAADTAFIGELGLDGSVRPVRGALAVADAARRAGVRTMIAASEDAVLMRLVPGLDVHAVTTLSQTLSLIRGETSAMAIPQPPVARQPNAPKPDLREPDLPEPDLIDVRGHAFARFAVEVAAAGGHHCALVGEPGVGKSLIGYRLVSLLPDLDPEQAVEVTTLHSLTRAWDAGLLRRPVMQAPHHSASAASLLGTVRGSQVLPGAVSLAHHGVLILDEAPEFARPCLEGLRQPMESGVIALHRVGRLAVLPARCQVVLTANPCPCGKAVGDGADCRCTPMARRRYADRLSGPLLDRIDVRVAVTRPTAGELAQPGEPSASVAERVRAARERAVHRFRGQPWSRNAEIPPSALRTRWAPTGEGVALLEAAFAQGSSMRGLDRVLRMAWTVCDLAGVDRPCQSHVATALGLRGSVGPS